MFYRTYGITAMMILYSNHVSYHPLMYSSLPYLIGSTTLPHDQQHQAFHFPMKVDDLALISELDFTGACRSLVKRSREVDILGMSLRQCPEVLVMHGDCSVLCMTYFSFLHPNRSSGSFIQYRQELNTLSAFVIESHLR